MQQARKIGRSGKYLFMSKGANTGEENTNRSVWWVLGIVVVACLGAVVWYSVGQLGVGAETGAINAATQASSQSGLNGLLNAAQTGTGGFGVSPQTTTFKAP